MRAKRKAAVRKYAEGTKVSIERSRNEIDALLTKHGAPEVGIHRNSDRHIVVYRLQGRMVRHVVHCPEPKQYPTAQAQEAEFMRRWRALVLITKAKLEMVSSGERTFEQEFLTDILLPDGTTVGELLGPKLIEAYETGTMPPLLGPGT